MADREPKFKDGDEIVIDNVDVHEKSPSNNIIMKKAIGKSAKIDTRTRTRKDSDYEWYTLLGPDNLGAYVWDHSWLVHDSIEHRIARIKETMKL